MEILHETLKLAGYCALGVAIAWAWSNVPRAAALWWRRRHPRPAPPHHKVRLRLKMNKPGYPLLLDVTCDHIAALCDLEGGRRELWGGFGPVILEAENLGDPAGLEALLDDGEGPN